MELDSTAEYQDLETEEGSYRSVSLMAVLALVLGLLSPLAFAHALLWTVPIVGAALAVAAIARIDRSSGELVGRKAAVAGLALALIAGMGAVTYTIARPLWLARRADQLAQRFLDLLAAGEAREAHQLWARPQFRFLPGGNLEELYAEHPQAQKDYESFVERPNIKDLLALGREAQIEHEKTRHTYRDEVVEYLMAFYRVRGTTPDGEIDKRIKLIIERAMQEDKQERWRVSGEEEVFEEQ
jgi:hypothetical protein